MPLPAAVLLVQPVVQAAGVLGRHQQPFAAPPPMQDGLGQRLHAPVQAGQKHMVELQPLGLVNGEDLQLRRGAVAGEELFGAQMQLLCIQAVGAELIH